VLAIWALRRACISAAWADLDREIEGDRRRRLVRSAPVRTEDIYKIYAESFRGTDHLRHIVAEA